MLIYFARHGQTDDNLRGVIQGQLDTPLNDHGRAEAALLGKHLANIPFREIWSSSLSRAYETAEIVARLNDQPSLTVRSHSGLMERGLGSLEGRRRGKGEALPPDVESGDDFRARIAAWFQAFLLSHQKSDESEESEESEDSAETETDAPSKAHPNDDTSILIVSHGAFLSTFLSLLLSPHYFGFTPSPTLDIRAPCLNTCIMRVRVHFDAPERAQLRAAEQDAGREAGQKTQARLEGKPRIRDLLQGRKEGKRNGDRGKVEVPRYRGVVESWGEVEHLGKTPRRKHRHASTVADDVKA